MSNSETIGDPHGSAIILGSVNVDNFIYVDAFPEPGETILATGGNIGLGGKGANQAVAASMLGTKVTFIGQVGQDAAAEFVRRQFEDFGVGGKDLLVSEDAPTGSAYITVNKRGENTICVVSGANAHISHEDVDVAVEQVFGTDAGTRVVSLAQGETRVELTEFFAAKCAAKGVRFVLNLAPFVSLNDATLGLADPLIVNEGEALRVLQSIHGTHDELEGVDSAVAAARLLGETVSRSVVITLGSDGAVVAEGGESWHQPSPMPRRVIDTTGAGDAFVGAVVAVLARGETLREAVRWGVAAGSTAVERRGTTESYPRLEQLEKRIPSEFAEL